MSRTKTRRVSLLGRDFYSALAIRKFQSGSLMPMSRSVRGGAAVAYACFLSKCPNRSARQAAWSPWECGETRTGTSERITRHAVTSVSEPEKPV